MAEKIAVTTDELKKKQVEGLGLFDQIEASVTGMSDLLGRLDQFFVGKPVEVIKSNGFSQQEEGIAALKQLKVHLKKLEEIYRIYDQAERSNSDVISDN